jgi:A/G-specific adenine glycosylase
MNFGALICKPAKPNCDQCPFTTGCKAYQLQLTEHLPVTLPKKEKTNRYFHYFILYNPKTVSTVIQQRSGNDIWQNLFEFPLIEHDAEGELPKQKSDVLLSFFDIDSVTEQPLQTIYKTQNLTHQKIHFNIQIFLWNGLIKDKTDVYQTVKVSNLSSFGFPVTLAKMVSQLKNMIGSTIKEK